MTRTRNMLLATAVLGLALTGCTASVNVTVPASSVADQAAKALQKQVGSAEAPGMDCGTDAVPLKEGHVVDCTLTDPVSGSEYDAKVTLSDIKGTNYHIDVQVAAKPKG